jgi:tetratricopeptide (TPR) repeat protein
MVSTPAARWADLAKDLPVKPDAYLQALNALVAKGEHETAEAGFVAAMAQFPANAAFLARYARAAEARGEWAEAAARWEKLRVRQPGNKVMIQALAACWVRIGRTEDADALLTETLAEQPDAAAAAADPVLRRLMIDHARMANSRRDFAAAAARWKVLLQHAPDEPGVKNGFLEMETLERLEAVDAGADAPVPPPASGQDMPHAGLMQHFEGMGGTCEFGLVQRHFGAEPLGLFRWVTLSADKLRDALLDKLDGIGNAEYTRLGVSPANLFYTDDTRYGLAMQTFIRNTSQDQEQLGSQLQRRMRFLRGKLLEDLAAGDKIFVYRCRRMTTDDEILPIGAALRTHNPNNILMAIRMLPHGAAGESLQWLAPGVLCGAIGDGRKPVKGTGWNINYDFWLQTCQQAVEMLRAAGRNFG